jgi:uncharacterized membrane protein
VEILKQKNKAMKKHLLKIFASFSIFMLALIIPTVIIGAIGVKIEHVCQREMHPLEVILLSTLIYWIGFECAMRLIKKL